MPFIPVAGGVEAQLRQTLHGEQVENTLWFEALTTINAANLGALAAELIDWWVDDFRAPLSYDLSLREVYLTDQSSANGIVHTQGAASPNPVGLTNESGLPGNVAFCVSFRTAQRGRSFRGRNYVAGLPEGQVTGNTVTPGTIAGIWTAYNALFARMTSLGLFRWVVVSRFANNAPRVAGVLTPVTSVSIVDSTVDSQRRRLSGRGV